MKNLQKTLCFFFALLFSFNSISAQYDSLILASKSPIIDEYIKFVFADSLQKICDANIFSISFLADDYLPMIVKSCKQKGKAVHKFILIDETNTKHKGKYSLKTGLVLKNETGSTNIYGQPTIFKGQNNSLTVIDAGKNSYLSFLIPSINPNEQIFFLTSKKDLKQFSLNFNQFLANQLSVMEFELKAQLASDKKQSLGSLKLSKKEDKTVIELKYNGEISTFVTE